MHFFLHTVSLAPKRAKSAYIIFSSEKLPQLQKEFKERVAALKEGETAPPKPIATAASMWKALIDDDRSKYIKAAEQDKERYEKEMQQYLQQKEQ